MSNGRLEVVVVPEVGGVVQMFFEDQDDGPFYIEPLRASASPDSPPRSIRSGERFVLSAAGSVNPAASGEESPEEWKVDVRKGEIVLRSESESIAKKRISMNPFEPVLQVSTASGWNRSGLYCEPVGMMLRLRNSGTVYIRQNDGEGRVVLKQLNAGGDSVSPPSDWSGRLAWVGDDQVLLVEMATAAKTSVNVRNSTEDPELFEVVVALSGPWPEPGRSVGRGVSYRLFRRDNKTTEDAAREVLEFVQ